MATLTELVSYVRSQSLVESDDLETTRLESILNRGYLELAASSDWPWLATSTTFVVTSGNRTGTLPADFLRIHRIEDSDEEEVNPLDWEVDQAAGVVRFFEDADADTTYTIWYFAEPDALTSLDSPAFNSAFHYILAEYALWKVLQREEMYERANVHKLEYYELFGAMRNHYNVAGTPQSGWAMGESGDKRNVRTNLPFLLNP